MDNELSVLHVDINSYFAAILQQENPKLRNKPVGVVKSKGRTCIIAASKEAKKLGIKTGCLLKDAKQLAPDIIIVPAEFDIYLDATRKLKKIFESVTPNADIFSLDEAFLPIEDCKLLYPDPYKLALQIQEMIKEDLGEWVTCNIGISYNKLLAKIASETADKGTIKVVTRQNKDALLKKVKFIDVCGVGFRLEQRLKELDITHPYEINYIEDDILVEKFGHHLAQELRKIGQGEEPAILKRTENPYIKSVGRTITGYRLCDSEYLIKKTLYNLLDEATHKLRKMNMAGRYISMFVLGQNQSICIHKTLKFYVRHTNEIFDLLYYQEYIKQKRNFKVIRYGVRIAELKPLDQIQPTLLPYWYKNEDLYKTLDNIWEKYGLFSINTGLLTKGRIIRPEVTGYLGDKKYHLEN